MLKAVLTDLDNTLVLFDEVPFHQRYFDKLGRCFADLFSPEDMTTPAKTQT
jgi:hypothetical protein